MIATFNESNFQQFCDILAEEDKEIRKIILTEGYPPLWTRKPGFASLIHIILEQQVSLASAKAALVKLESRLGIITPSGLLSLTDEEMKACYFSRQKTRYARHLAESVLSKRLDLDELETQSDGVARDVLKQVNGIGDWTADIYLMMVLHRADCFPLGDIALITSLKRIKSLPPQTSRDQMAEISLTWKPYRTVVAFLLWHAYLSGRKPTTSSLVTSAES